MPRCNRAIGGIGLAGARHGSKRGGDAEIGGAGEGDCAWASGRVGLIRLRRGWGGQRYGPRGVGQACGRSLAAGHGGRVGPGEEGRGVARGPTAAVPVGHGGQRREQGKQERAARWGQVARGVRGRGLRGAGDQREQVVLGLIGLTTWVWCRLADPPGGCTHLLVTTGGLGCGPPKALTSSRSSVPARSIGCTIP